MSKILVTAGSSVSECETEFIDTWPRHLAKKFTTHIPLARGGVGNGYISRSVIYEVNRSTPDVVAIMWTNFDRIDLRLEEIEHTNTQAKDAYNMRKGADWPSYPVTWEQLHTDIQQEIHEEFPSLELLLKDPLYTWRRGFTNNRFWTNVSLLLDDKQYRNVYFLLFSDIISKQIYSLEHILRTQWFLESKKIPYFMMSSCDEVLNCEVSEETEHLISMIDHSKFIHNRGMVEWTMQTFGAKGFPGYPDLHPGTEQHKRFTEEVIIPYMENKCLL